MSRLPFVVACAVALGVVVTARQQPTFRANTHTVSIYTTVFDANGRLVPNLTRDDFEVYDNGIRQTLTVFDNGIQPITLVMLLDRSGSMAGNFRLVQDAAEEFVQDLLPGDRTRIGTFSSHIRIEPDTFTNDQQELLSILRRERPTQGGPTPLWNATAAAMDALAREEGRRVVLTFTDGRDTPGWIAPPIGADDIRRRTRTDEIMIYAIGLAERCAEARQGPSTGQPGVRLAGAQFPGPRGPQGPRFPGGFPPLPPIGPRFPGPEGPRGPVWPPVVTRPGLPPANPCAELGPDPELRDIAAEGGGGYFELRGTDNLRATFARVADELHRQYLLAFDAEALDGGLHQLDVRVRVPGLTARARRSYVAPRGD